MKRKYKILIVCSALVVLLLCSVFSVGAESNYESVFLNDIGDISFIRWGNAHGETIDKPAYSVKVNSNNEAQVYAALPYNDGFFQITHWILVIEPDADWFYSLDPSKDYSLIFIVGQDGTYSDPEQSQFTQIGMALKDSNGALIEKVKTPPTVHQDNKQYTWFQFTAKELRRLSNIDQIQIQFSIYPNVYQNRSTVGMIVQSRAAVTVTDPTLDAIQGGLKDNADQITDEIQQGTNDLKNEIQQGTDEVVNGWEPNPEKPQGSNKVDDMTQIENEIEQGAQEGIDTGNNLLQNFGTLFTSFTTGFLFFIGIFNLLFSNAWLTTLLQISLVLGLIAFILNIVPSIGSRIGRDQKKQNKPKGKGGG